MVLNMDTEESSLYTRESLNDITSESGTNIQNIASNISDTQEILNKNPNADSTEIIFSDASCTNQLSHSSETSTLTKRCYLPSSLELCTTNDSCQSSEKTCETDLVEERDTFSPLNDDIYQTEQLLSEENYCENGFISDCINSSRKTFNISEIDNKIYDKKKTKTSTKEEKQRQNEEIVTMETSSVSSETGSWESIFPHRTNTDIKDCCLNFLQNERNYCIKYNEQMEINKVNIKEPVAGSTACFIDASTLLDESELNNSNYKKITSVIDNKEENQNNDLLSKAVNFDKLETFHKSFELCKNKKSLNSDFSSNSSSGESPLKSGSLEESTNNLSDEEKLLKRNFNKKNLNDNNSILNTIQLDQQETLNTIDNDTSRIRKDFEKKQGDLVFQNSIKQFSGHLNNPEQIQSNEIIKNDFNGLCNPWSRTDLKFNESSYGTTDDNLCSSLPTINHQNILKSLILPDTPHNSIMQINLSHMPNASNDLIDMKNSEISYNNEDIKISKRIQRCDESTPIISGGVSINDITPKKCESPSLSRRKTDTCPIISGGFMSLDIPNENDEKRKHDKMKSKPVNSLSSWVVDMSDGNKQRCRSTSSSSSTENVYKPIDNSIEQKDNNKKNGLGFYVSLNELDETKSNDLNNISTHKLNKLFNGNTKKGTGFYVDFSESENSKNTTPPSSINNQTPPCYNSNSIDKKNIFSMFIDIGDKKKLIKKEPISLASRLSNSLHYKKETDLIKKLSSSLTETNNKNNNQCNNDQLLDSTGDTAKTSSDESKSQTKESLCRITTRHILKDDIKRHSWNNTITTNSNPIVNNQKDHKRSASLSADKNIMNIIDKIPIISKTSSLSIDSSISTFDDNSCSKSEISISSNNSNSMTSISINSSTGENRNLIKKSKKRYRHDVEINETFDKSSQGSLTDGIFSKESSPISTTTTDTEELTFQQDENLYQTNELISINENCKKNDICMENILETKEINKVPIIKRINSQQQQQQQPIKNELNVNQDEIIFKKNSSHTMETLHATIEKQKQLLETVIEHVEVNTNFVKLSDMDKPPLQQSNIQLTKFELHSPETQIMSKSVGSSHRHVSRLFQDTTKSRPHSWSMMTRSTGNSVMNITSSVENLRSLTRLFPHLSKELSNSLPANVSFDINSRILTDNNINDYNNSDISGESSLTSSISRSGMDESSISCRQPRRLGEDLLKMFLQEIATDVIIEVNGRRIKAHKCILRSRCQYFAAMLAGGWVQSAGNVLSLTGYSYSSVHFALCHIYSGASHPPDGISLMELAALADLLCLEGLKEVTAHTLKMNYCHNFHKPCSGCIDGILQVLPVALNHSLDDLYRKCLKWTCKYYLKVWPTRSFAGLPSDIYSRCKQQIVAHLTSETVLDAIIDCDNLISQLAPCRWATNIENIIRHISDAAYTYICDHFASLIASDSFLSLGHDKNTYIPRLEGILLRIASSLTPDQACRSYQRITRLNSVLATKVTKAHNNINNIKYEIRDEDMDWNEEFLRLINAIHLAVEQCLIRQCARAMRVVSWQRMDLELRKKIQKLACLTEPFDLRRNKSVPKQISYNINSRNQDLYQVKLAIQAHSKRALSQDTQLYRATAHTQTQAFDHNAETTEKAVQANNETKGKIVKNLTKSLANTSVTQNPKICINKPCAIVHRRTQSEDSSTISKEQRNINRKACFVGTNRNTEIRPRYLEPRKPRMPLKSQTSSNILSIKNGKQISSSDSSRTSSPATGKRISAIAFKKGNLKSVNMSLDSLASPSKRSDKIKEKPDNEISIDSLADSMKSSLKTDKTLSQESLNHSGAIRNKIIRSNPIINKENKNIRTIQNKFVKNKSLSCQTSGSSPSSITNKSSRLSSTTSSMNSPRDAFKNRSISVPAGSETTTVRKSFVSAKSREILARKSAIQNANKNQKDLNSTEKFKSGAIDKSNSTSNIPTRRSMPPTTLHLRKTARVQPTLNNGSSKIMNKNGITLKTENKNIKRLNELKKDTHELIEVVIENPNEICIESKLERSSTFCKEASDLPGTELQVIE